MSAGSEMPPRKGALAIPWGGERAADVQHPGRFAEHAARLFGALSAAVSLEIDRRRLFLWLPVLYGAGIVAYFAAEKEPWLAASIIPAAMAAAAALALRRRFAMLVVLLATFAFFAGFAVATLRTKIVTAPVLKAPVSTTVIGRIEAINRTIYGGRMVVTVHDLATPVERMPERVRVTFRGRMAMSAGDAVQFKARLMPPGAPAVPGGFDFQREAYFLGIGAVGLVSGAVAPAEIGPSTFLTGVFSAVDRARNALTERIVGVIGGSKGAIAAALVTGKRGEIAEADNEAWRGAGIYHIISISGLHMVIAAGLFFWSARLVLAAIPGFSPQNAIKKWAAVAAMCGAVAYNIFSGSEVATERAMIMTLVMLGAILFDRPALAMRNLAISALIVLTLNPEAVLGPSFQMSFGAVAGLVTYGETMRHWREKRTAVTGHDTGLPGRLGRGAFDFTMTSLIAGLATAPFQAFHFHRLNPFGVIGNALAVPICSFLVMPAALLGVVLYPLGLDAPAWLAMGWGIEAINIAAGWVSAMPGAVATILRFSSGSLLLLALGFLAITLMTTLPFRALGVVLVCLGLLSAGSSAKPEMIFDPTGRAALVRADDRLLAFLGRSRPVFNLQQWLPGDRDGRAPRDASLAQAVRCDPLGCTLARNSGNTVALVLDAQAFAEDCERAKVIVTPLVAPDRCWNNAEIYDRNWFERYGATYIYAADGNRQRFETARNPRLERPWIPVNTPAVSRRSEPTREAPAPQRGGSAWDPAAPDDLESVPAQ